MSRNLGIAAVIISLIAIILIFNVNGQLQTLSAQLQQESEAREKQAAADAGADVVKVVYHADFADPRRFSAMLTSINNMVTTYQNDFVDYDVRIVFVAHGIRFLTEDALKGTLFEADKALMERRAELITRLGGLQDVQGVKLELCDITRQAIGLEEDKLIPNVTLVRSGVVQVAKLQHEGFAYIKIE